MPIQSITRALQCLININERKEAIAWLEKVTRSAKQWKCVIQGWATAAVLTAFVPIADALEGKQSAKDLAALAQKHAAKEPQSGFRQGAAGMAMQTQSELGEIDAAIAEALKIRSPAARRHQLAILYAKAKRWSDLHAICKQIDDPKDAAHTAWWVKFELPGGDHRVLV